MNNVSQLVIPKYNLIREKAFLSGQYKSMLSDLSIFNMLKGELHTLEDAEEISPSGSEFYIKYYKGFIDGILYKHGSLLKRIKSSLDNLSYLKQSSDVKMQTERHRVGIMNFREEIFILIATYSIGVGVSEPQWGEGGL